MLHLLKGALTTLHTQDTPIELADDGLRVTSHGRMRPIIKHRKPRIFTDGFQFVTLENPTLVAQVAGVRRERSMIQAQNVRRFS